MKEVRTLLHPVTGAERVMVVEARDSSLARARGDARPPVAAPMMAMIRPSVRDRWMATSLRNYTPEKVEQVCRGAMAGELSAQWEMFDLMEQTWPRLSKNLNQIKDSVVAMEWSVQAWAPKGGKPSAEAQKRAALVEELIWGMEPREVANENDFEGTLRDLLDAKGKGIVALEIDWENGDSSYGNTLRPRCTRWVHPRNYGYPNITGTELADELMLDARQITIDGGVVPAGALIAGGFLPFPKNQFIIGIWKQKSGHPISGALLRILGFWWVAANFAAEWFLNYAQIFGMPIRWANYDPSLPQSDRDILEEMLQCMGSAGYALFPSGVNLELKEASKGATDNPHLGVLHAADKVCDILILRQTLSTDTGERGSGSKALGQVHEDVLGQVIIGAGDWAAAKLNAQLVRPICELNFGDNKECPWLMPAIIEEADEVAMADRDVKLSGIGVRFPLTYIHDRYKIPMPNDGEPVLEPPALPAFDAGADPGADPGAETDAGKTADPAKKVNAKAADGVHPHAHDAATDKLLEQVTSVDAKWLGSVRPYFAELIAMARDARSEEEFEAKLKEVIAKSARKFPELFPAENIAHLADAFEKTMGASCVNGAVNGYLKRRNSQGSRGRSSLQEAGR